MYFWLVDKRCCRSCKVNMATMAARIMSHDFTNLTKQMGIKRALGPQMLLTLSQPFNRSPQPIGQKSDRDSFWEFWGSKIELLLLIPDRCSTNWTVKTELQKGQSPKRNYWLVHWCFDWNPNGELADNRNHNWQNLVMFAGPGPVQSFTKLSAMAFWAKKQPQGETLGWSRANEVGKDENMSGYLGLASQFKVLLFFAK